jgi:hypothetical protein
MWCNGIVGLPLAIVICTWKSRIVSLCILFKFVLLYVKGLRLILPTKLVTESPENCRGKVPLTWQDLRSRKTKETHYTRNLVFWFCRLGKGGRNQEIRASLLSSKETWATKKPLSDWPKHLKKILQASKSNEVHKHPKHQVVSSTTKRTTGLWGNDHEKLMSWLILHQLRAYTESIPNQNLGKKKNQTSCTSSEQITQFVVVL